MPDLADFLDFDAGWRRAKLDLTAKRTFVRHPFQLELVDIDLPVWLEALRSTVKAGTYTPSPMEVCDVPKPGAGIRPGSILQLEDATVYAACIDAALPQLFAYISSQTQGVDFAYRLKEPETRDGWFLRQLVGWHAFAADSITRIDAGAQWVLTADIAGFFEHIDLATLASDLRSAEVEPLVIAQLSKLLNRWAKVSGRGIPQGHSPSDILAKLYLAKVDYNIRAMGYIHNRYVDDIRIYCADLATAKRSIIDLSELLRSRGLSVQSAKLKILRADSARLIFGGIRPIVANISRDYLHVLREYLQLSDPYASIEEAEAYIERASVENIPVDILRHVFDAYFGIASGEFQKTLFHFLLNRLSSARDTHAVSRMMDCIINHPEETGEILSYLVKCGGFAIIEDELFAFLRSADAVYQYQLYQVVEALVSSGHPCDPTTRSFIIALAFDTGRPQYLRAMSRGFLRLHGTQADFERLEAASAAEVSPLGQAEIICALKNMERGRRNAFLARVAGSGDYQRRAVAWCKR